MTEEVTLKELECRHCGDSLGNIKWWQYRARWKRFKKCWWFRYNTARMVRLTEYLLDDLTKSERWFILTLMPYDDLKEALQWKELSHVITGDDI